LCHIPLIFDSAQISKWGSADCLLQVQN
jgi:hypothetical protein